METRQTALENYENIIFNPLVTDAYQLSMGEALRKTIENNLNFDAEETFELFFRKNPFKGSFAIAGGIDDALKFISRWNFTDYHESLMRFVYGETYSSEYYTKLKSLNSTSLTVWSVLDGDVVFADEPMIRITGNALLGQLLETTLLNIVGHATLVATIAARIKLRCHSDVKLLEFGCRRAQGMTASINSARYSYIGGFDGTSHVLAGAMYDIPVSGTHAHSFVMRFINLNDVSNTLIVTNLKDVTKPCENFKQYVLDIHTRLNETSTHLGELGAFIQYAYTFPSKFIALIDTYNTLESGVLNYCSVAIALIELGYQPLGVRLDSGDLATLSIKIDDMFVKMSESYPEFGSMTIVASNDLDEETINELTLRGSKCKAYGIGTNLATAKDQPSLGCVYKLADRGGIPRMKKSEEPGKTTIPGKKYVFRLFDENNYAIADVMTLQPSIDSVGNTITLYNPKNADDVKSFVFSRHEMVLKPVIFSGFLQILHENATFEGRERCINSMKILRENFTRLESPDKYFVGVDQELMLLLV